MSKYNKNWFGIMKIIDIKQWRDGEIIWKENNILNLLHKSGEQFLLRAAFVGGQTSSVIPAFYFLGMDNRNVLSVDDTLESLVSEPGSNGYTRQSLTSNGDFTVILDDDGHYRAVSPIVAFQASIGSWGPVVNLFLASTIDNSGSLISTAKFSVPVTVNAGDSVTMRIALSLKDCPPE